MRCDNYVLRVEQGAERKLKSWVRKFEREVVDIIDPRLRRSADLMNTGKPRVAKKNTKRLQKALRAAGCYVELTDDMDEFCLALKRVDDDVSLVALGVVIEYRDREIHLTGTFVVEGENKGGKYMGTSIKRLGIEKLKERLKTYPGAHPGEDWKLETDLTKCKDKEKEMLGRYGLTVEDLMAEGINRGELHHMLFGYLHPSKRKRL